jgi:hypothetical protein
MRSDAWTPDEEAWLRGAYPAHHNRELSEMHAELFPDRPRRTPSAINSRAGVLGLRKADGFQRNPPRMWTPGKIAWFRAFVPGHTEAEISAEHERLYGFPLREGQIGNAKSKFGVKSGTHGGRFEKGHDGGFASEAHRRAFLEAGKATQFKKGQVSGSALARRREVGYERVNADGYVEVKVHDGLQSRPNRNFRPKHHVVYEQAHGPIPDGCNIVFADGDKRNFDPDNLVAVPRATWATISRKHLEHHDADGLRACMAIAELDSAVHRARCAPRVCGVCGRVFDPRYAHQRTCDSCLDAGRKRR